MRRFVFREEHQGEAPVRVASCYIPATSKAVDVMYRLLDINKKARLEDGPDETEVIALQSCPSSSCLDPLIVVAPPRTSGGSSGGGSQIPDDCWSFYGCDDSAMQWYENSGGDEPDPESYLPTDICPQRQAGCLQDLDANQSTGIAQALSQVRTDIPNLAVQEICTGLQNVARTMLASGQIKAGSPDIPDGPRGEDHSAEYDPLTVQLHVDESFLDAAIQGGYYQSLGALILHEAAHKAGYNHPATEQAPYTTFPFLHTSYTGYSRVGVHECM